MIPLTYVIPPALETAHATGAVRLFGAVLKETATGRIVAHVQPTGMFDQVLATATKGLGATVSQGFSPLGAAALVQNQMIWGKLNEINSTLGVLQSLQIASLAVSGLGLGISLANLVVLQRGLKRIEQHLDHLADAIERVTANRRRDEVRHDLNQIRVQIDVVASLDDRADKVTPGHGAQQALAALAGRVETHVLNHLEEIRTSRVTESDLDLIWSLTAAIRLCHDMGARALYTIDDLGGAAALTARQATRFVELVDTMQPPDALARLAAIGADDRQSATEARDRLLPFAQRLRTGLHETAASLMSQSTLSRQLIEQGARGPEYIEAVNEHSDVPLLFLPSGT